MSDLLKNLRDARLSTWEQAKVIAERADAEKRQFTAEEQASWDKANADISAYDARMKSILDAESRAAETEARMAELERAPKNPGAPAPQVEGADASDELRSFLNGETRALEFKPGKNAFATAMAEYRTGLVKGTPTAGGDVVPTSFYNQLVQHLIVNSAIMQAGATVLNTTSGETIQIPKTTSHNTAALVAEQGAIGESDPVFGQASLGAYKYANLIGVSYELTQDTGVDLNGYLAQHAGASLGNAFGADAVTGNGTNKPSGVVTGATLGVTGGTGVVGAFTSDNLIDLFYSVIAPYRASTACHWMMNDASLAVARKFKSTTQEYIWQPSYQIGAPDTILGKPVLTDPNIATTALSAKSVLFGDFSRYFIRLAGNIRFERSVDYAFNTDVVTFRAIMRADGVLVDTTGAVKYFAGGAT